MSNTLYLECNSGISGDMTVAALLDLGASEQVLMEALDSIPADGFSVEVTRVKKSGIDCCDFAVLLDEEHENHDHDMEYLHGHKDHHHEHDHHHGKDHHHGALKTTTMSMGTTMRRTITMSMSITTGRTTGITMEKVMNMHTNMCIPMFIGA